MNKSRVERVTDDELIEALENSGGIIQEAADYIGEHFRKAIARETISRRIAKSEELQEIQADAIEATKDLAEEKLYKAIKAGNLTAVIFFLKTRGKARGYSERQEIKAQAEIKTVTENPFKGMSKEELIKLVRNETPNERRERLEREARESGDAFEEA